MSANILISYIEKAFDDSEDRAYSRYLTRTWERDEMLLKNGGIPAPTLNPPVNHWIFPGIANPRPLAPVAVIAAPWIPARPNLPRNFLVPDIPIPIPFGFHDAEGNLLPGAALPAGVRWFRKNPNRWEVKYAPDWVSANFVVCFIKQKQKQYIIYYFPEFYSEY